MVHSVAPLPKTAQVLAIKKQGRMAMFYEAIESLFVPETEKEKGKNEYNFCKEVSPMMLFLNSVFSLCKS
jgi:predicted phage-related endonuclease